MAVLGDVTKLLERTSELATVGALVRRGGVLVVEGRAGLGKTAILDAACGAARRHGRLVLRARASELEVSYAFGIARGLLERHCVQLSYREKAALFRGAARASRALLTGEHLVRADSDASFAVMHGLYWLVVNIAMRQPALLAVDDCHWADSPSLNWLAYLASRIAGIGVSLIVTLRPEEPGSRRRAILAVRQAADATLRPALLSKRAVGSIARKILDRVATADDSAELHRITGGNPFYLWELLRALRRFPTQQRAVRDLVNSGGLERIALHLEARLKNLDARALRLAQAMAILGDGCELRHAAAISQIENAEAYRLAGALVHLDVLAQDRPLQFIHPIVQDALLKTQSSAEHDAAHRAAAEVLHAEGAPPGRVGAHAIRLRTSGDPWVVERLRESARAALHDGAPASAADLFERALAEPPPIENRVGILRDAGWAHLEMGRALGCQRLEEALAIAGASARPQLAAQLAQAYASLFRWPEAVRVLERVLESLDEAQRPQAAYLQAQLIATGLQDARVAPRALRELRQVPRHPPPGAAAITLDVARGMIAVLTGQRSVDSARPLERALAAAATGIESRDLQAALWWSLIAAERFSPVLAALKSSREQVDRSGSARGLIAVYSSLAVLQFRLGALPEADAAARVALKVAREGDFAPGLAFAATVLADTAVAAGELDEAQALLDQLPKGELPAGVGTVLIPAGRGRLRLAQGRFLDALSEFEECMELWRPEVWGIELRDVGYVHARSGAAQALLALGEVGRACALAEAELVDVHRFGGRRAVGVALRIAGLARGGARGLTTLQESVAVLSESPAVLEYAWSLVEWGAALRRSNHRQEARRALTQGLDVAARCGARPLIAYADSELRIAGFRPRRHRIRGAEALTPSELRIAWLAREGRSNRQIA